MSRAKRGRTSATFVARAREFRREGTPAEEVLWCALRDRQCGGLKFRRQHPFEHLILDFFCVEHQIAVEVDGTVHDEPAQREYDRARDAFLAERGIRVVHIRNDDIAVDLQRALATILAAAKTSHHTH